MKPSTSWLPAFALAAGIGAPSAAAAQLGPVLRVKLENGLTLLMIEDHRMPRVGVAVAYAVGSRDDPPGFQGLAHVVEHALGDFRGHVPEGGMQRLERLGAYTNATTAPDETYFYSDLPAPALETALWVESDRMAYLLSELNASGLSRIVAIVGRELREKHGQLDWLEREAAHALFPAPHPYRDLHLQPDELENIDLNAVRFFFQRHYGPGMAALAIVGDIDPAATERAVQKYFGPIRDSVALLYSRPPVHQPAPTAREIVLPPPIDANWRYERIRMMWPTPAQYAAGDAALDVAATLLAERLSESLVRSRSVFSASVAQESAALGSSFVIDLDLVPGHRAREVLEIIDHELATLAAQSPGFERAQKQWIARLLGRLDQFTSVASMIARAELRGLRVSPRDNLERYQALSAADVARAVQRYLTLERRIVVRTEFSWRAATPHRIQL